MYSRNVHKIYIINTIETKLEKNDNNVYFKLHSEKKVVPATRNLRTNNVSTMYYKVVITITNK